jgi:hypothetical protein
MYGIPIFRGFFFRLLACGFLLLGGLQVSSAVCDCPNFAWAKGNSGHTIAVYSTGFDNATAFRTFLDNGGIRCDSGSGGTALIYPLIVRDNNTGVLLGNISSGDASTCQTNNTVTTSKTNYYVNFCWTNKLGTYQFPNAVLYSGAGYATATKLCDGCSVAPGAYICYAITNQPGSFYISIGDPIYHEQEPPEIKYPSSNVVQTIETPASSGGTPNVGGVTGNPNSSAGSSGLGNTSGTTNLATVQTIYTANDAQIQAMAQNTFAILGQLEKNRTNGTSGSGTNLDYTGLLNAIRTNTQNSADIQKRAEDLMTNQQAHGYFDALVSGSNIMVAASNLMSGMGVNLNALNYGGSVTGYVPSIVNGFLGSSLPAGFGVLTIVSTAPGVADTVIDFSTALNGSAWNPYLGSGWRTWFRVLCLWLLFLGMLTWYVSELRKGLTDISSSSQLQVGPESLGAGSLVPGAEIALRVLLVTAAATVVAFFPALVVVLVSTTMAVTHSVQGGSGPGDIGAAISTITTIYTSVPTVVTNVFRSVNSWIPLVEGAVILLNQYAARLLIDTMVGFLAFLFKLLGI